MDKSLIVLICLLISCFWSSLIGGIYANPLPKKVEGEYEKFTQISEKRVPLSTSGASEIGKSCKDVDCHDKISSCKDLCEADFTCKGFSFWTDNDTPYCYRYRTKPNEWKSIPQFISNKTNSKIFSLN